MTYVFTAVMFIGPIAFVVGLVGAFGPMLLLLPGSTLFQILGRAAAAVGTGVVGYFVGTATGIFGFCTLCACGNLCGLGAFVGTGPLVAGVCMAAFGLALAKQVRGTY